MPEDDSAGIMEVLLDARKKNPSATVYSKYYQ